MQKNAVLSSPCIKGALMIKPQMNLHESTPLIAHMFYLFLVFFSFVGHVAYLYPIQPNENGLFCKVISFTNFLRNLTLDVLYQER